MHLSKHQKVSLKHKSLHQSRGPFVGDLNTLRIGLRYIRTSIST